MIRCTRATPRQRYGQLLNVGKLGLAFVRVWGGRDYGKKGASSVSSASRRALLQHQVHQYGSYRITSGIKAGILHCQERALRLFGHDGVFGKPPGGSLRRAKHVAGV